MENKENIEIDVEKELPKTLEEYFIKEIESYKKMNANLVEAIRIERNLNHKRNEEASKWKNKYYELVEQLKEDFVPIIKKASCDDKYFKFNEIYIWKENNEVKFEYYKNLFNLKEEGEEENE